MDTLFMGLDKLVLHIDYAYIQHEMSKISHLLKLERDSEKTVQLYEDYIKTILK